MPTTAEGTSPVRNTRPILPGDYPDPSICRVGDTFWLVSSSFESFPGLPVHRSTDLVTWGQVGHVYDRPSTLPLPLGNKPSSGTFAPTIRHHDGVFYVIVTNMGTEPMEQTITSTADPAQGWSAPVSVPGTAGIDPDLCWDEDGVCHLTWRGFGRRDGHFAGGIHHVTIDPTTGERTGEETELWSGSGGRDAEGPHLYRRHGWWYLMLAEGGTGLGHMVTMARSRSLDGPWEENPFNPVLTHRSTDHPVQATGHADLVPLDVDDEHPDGSWDGERFAMVHLGIRPREPFPAVHVNGRETFLQGIDWSDDWPVVIEGRYAPAIAERDASTTRVIEDPLTGTPGPVATGDEPWTLGDDWVSPGGLARPWLVRDDAGHLTVGAPSDHDLPRPIIAVRARDEEWEASTTLTPDPDGVGELLVYVTPTHRAGVRWDGRAASAVVRIGPLEQVLGTVTLASPDRSARPYVEVRRHEGADPLEQWVDELVLGVRVSEGEAVQARELARFDGRHLSTEVAGGFTGRLVGVRAIGGVTRVEDFSYQAL